MTDPVESDALRSVAVKLLGDDYRTVLAAADEVDRLRAELAISDALADARGEVAVELRAVIENAPHERPCMLEIPEAKRDRNVPWECTCWKADAL